MRSAVLGLACLTVPAFGDAPAEGTLDLTVTALQVNQVLPGVTLIGGKSTMVRAVIGVSGTLPAGTVVDGLMRVFVNGVEEPYSPLFSENGPFTPPTSGPDATDINSSLNFTLVAPTADDVVFEVEINPAGDAQVIESDYSNNKTSTATLVFECTEKAEMVYVRVDYRPSGGGPNLPDEELIKPGVGDNFIQAVFPIADWDYRVSDAPSKLWTGNLSSSGSALLSSLLVDLQMTVPQPDLIYGWIPGSLPYNGQAIGTPGQAALGNTQNIRHQRTFAHEVGHLLNRQHISNTIGVVGIDVEHHLNLTEALPRVKLSNLNDIMVAGLLTNQAWVYAPNYEHFFNYGLFDCAMSAAPPAEGETLLVGGLWFHEEGRVDLTDVVAFDGGTPSGTVPLQDANLALRVFADGALAGEFGLLVNTKTDSCAGDSEDPVAPIGAFVAVLPASIQPANVERVEVVELSSGSVLQRMHRSLNAPQTKLSALNANSVLDRQVDLRWSVADADGDSLRHYLRYSPDGQRIVPLASGTTETSYQLDMHSVPELRAGGYFEVLTSDGLRTTSTRLTGLRLSSAAAGGSPPETHVLTPDDGMVYPVGNNVILHASGWDLEDRAIEGSDLVWTSDIDGGLGTGRVTSTSALSVGTHVLTVTATDSQGNTSTDTTTVTITDRDLPGIVTQPDLGFGGPGSSALVVQGGDLSAGTTADVRLTGAAPNALAWIAVGNSNNPTPALGGTLVPVPVAYVVSGVTDANGAWILGDAVVGGGGPATIYIQAVYMDAAIPTGFGFSNAVAINIL